VNNRYLLFIGDKSVATNPSNPLAKYFRQAKIYIRLPSKGKYYPPGSINIPESEEFAVYPMTAKDELTFKTPDALINGESVVQVIKSCIPDIKDPWKMPSIDSDAILIAIRLATYGEKMEVSAKLPVTGEFREFEIDLRALLDQLAEFEYEPFIQINQDITVELRPTNYKEFTKNSLKTFEEQRILRLVDDESISDENKLQAFSNSFKKLTDLTINMVVESIVSIDTPEGKVSNRDHIIEFFNNSDKSMFDTILKHLEKMKSNSTIKPMKVVSTPEDIAAGVPAEFEVPITFDQSNFFG
jgi:hypothetical protein